MPSNISEEQGINYTAVEAWNLAAIFYIYLGVKYRLRVFRNFCSKSGLRTEKMGCYHNYLKCLKIKVIKEIAQNPSWEASSRSANRGAHSLNEIRTFTTLFYNSLKIFGFVYIQVCWYKTSYRLVHTFRSFREVCWFHFQDRRRRDLVYDFTNLNSDNFITEEEKPMSFTKETYISFHMLNLFSVPCFTRWHTAVSAFYLKPSCTRN